MASVRQFFDTGWILLNFNSSIIALVPKIKDVVDIENFRPIAVANFKYKVISKILTDRLALLAPKLISPSSVALFEIVILLIVLAQPLNVLTWFGKRSGLVILF